LDRLVALLPAARRDWGPSAPEARSALRVAADGMRIVGRYGEATELYEDMARLARYGADPEDLADSLEGTLGAAECRVPFGDLIPAIDALSMVVDALPQLCGNRAQTLAARCREVGLELKELGFEEQVCALLPELREN
jgi:hypothetical protein